MNRFLLFCLLVSTVGNSQNMANSYVDELGEVGFFSHTSIENIRAINRQTSSIINTVTGEIEVNVLMKSFEFEKSAMFKHFNEHYLESDLYPTASFLGTIVDYDGTLEAPQVRIIRGELTLKESTIPLDIKVTIVPAKTSFTLKGKTKIKISDFNIDIPDLFASYITKTIDVSFDFEYTASKIN